MKVAGLVVLFVLIAVALVWVYAAWDRARPDDTPEVALAKRNLPEYARVQHQRAERLEALLRNVRGFDEVMPSLPTDLRQRIDRELEP
jgi:pyruvate/2-oxoglutarate/acetoin dehydrogenase E1 component